MQSERKKEEMGGKNFTANTSLSIPLYLWHAYTSL